MVCTNNGQLWWGPEFVCLISRLSNGESFSLIDVEKWVVCKWRKNCVHFFPPSTLIKVSPSKCQPSNANFIVNYLLFNSIFFINCAASRLQIQGFSIITMWNLLALNFWESSNSFFLFCTLWSSWHRKVLWGEQSIFGECVYIFSESKGCLHQINTHPSPKIMLQHVM